MKIQIQPSIRRREAGSATIIFTALLITMVILVSAEMRSLSQLHQETKWLEKQQIKRLDNSQTNLVAATLPESK